MCNNVRSIATTNLHVGDNQWKERHCFTRPWGHFQNTMSLKNNKQKILVNVFHSKFMQMYFYKVWMFYFSAEDLLDTFFKYIYIHNLYMRNVSGISIALI